MQNSTLLIAIAVGSVTLTTVVVVVWALAGLIGWRTTGVPDWVSFPGEEWQRISVEEAGLDPKQFRSWSESERPDLGVGYGGQKPARGGAVLTRGGYLVYSWGDPHFRYQIKSVGKIFTRLALQLAIDTGRIGSLDDPVRAYWTGEGELNQPHKYLNRGHHRDLTFRHLIEMTSGFPVTNGYFWEQKTDEGDQNAGIAAWANWTGDPDFDNYAHVPPGTQTQYSSGGYWRLSQALTVVWGRDLKQVLDERIFEKIGIPADRWEWLSGQAVREDVHFYPDFPNYGGFVDPPYAVDGSPVLGGGGWVVISASDLARLGLLFATGGIWKGERLIAKDLGGWYLEGNGRAGMPHNAVDGYRTVRRRFGLRRIDAYVSFGRVAGSLREPTRREVAAWIVGPIARAPVQASCAPPCSAGTHRGQ